MATEMARKFLQKLQEDSKFRSDLVNVTREQGHIGRSNFIKNNGFNFDASDLHNAKLEYVGKIPKDLTAIVDFITCGMVIVDPPTTRVA